MWDSSWSSAPDKGVRNMKISEGKWRSHFCCFRSMLRNNSWLFWGVSMMLCRWQCRIDFSGASPGWEVCVFGKIWVFWFLHSLYVCIYPDDSGGLPLQLFIISNRHVRILSLKSYTLLIDFLLFLPLHYCGSFQNRANKSLETPINPLSLVCFFFNVSPSQENISRTLHKWN